MTLPVKDILQGVILLTLLLGVIVANRKHVGLRRQNRRMREQISAIASRHKT